VASTALALVLVAALAACAGETGDTSPTALPGASSPAPADSATPGASETPTATPTETPEPEAPVETADPSATPAPEETALPAPTASAAPSTPPAATAEPTPPAADPPASAAIDDPASYSVVVNKLRPLAPADYAAPDLVSVPVPYANAPVLRQAASDAVVAMFAQFTAETGLQMQSQSAYRPYQTQVEVYAGWVASKGQAGADLTSARPGFSEHQTGLAIDVSALPSVCALQACFADTPQGQWLAANSWKYGFVLRYPSGQTAITGYEFEPWHYRYVGVETATDYFESGSPTLESYFGLPAAPTYAG
jgi:D-alanyl-D-alanine carboxypeptidase